MEPTRSPPIASGRRGRRGKSSLSTNAWLKSRERGACRAEPSCSFYGRRLYENVRPFARFDPTMCPDRSQGHIRSGVFGLEFSADGRVLGVAAENKSLSFFDPLRPPDPFLTVANAHRDCVNCVKFLDNRLLASCSDDHSVKLWDLRQMKSDVRTLNGHTSWVKNVEFAADKGILVTSGFDHNVYAWDINNPECCGRRLLNAEGLMRMRLTPSADKMVLSTQYGYLLVVHELDLDKLAEDMRGFKPNTYWISIETRSLFPPGREHLKRFTADRNRTELVIDFPRGCDPDHISCISPHPHGWAIAGRMNNTDDRSEWTTVHDLQLPAVESFLDDEGDNESKGDEFMPVDVDSNSAARGRPQSEHRRSTVIHLRTERRPGSSYAWAESDSSSSSEDDAIPSPYGELVRRNRWARNFQSNWSFGIGGVNNTQSASPSTSSSSAQQASSTNTTREQQQQHIPLSRGPRLRIINSINPQRPGRTVVIFGGRDPPSSTSSSSSSGGNPDSAEDSPAAPKTYRRLTYFKEEPRQGRGFIKELCWAPNGRVIASPYAFGCRLLAFDDGCRELCDIHWRGASAAQPLTEIKSLVGDEGHSDVVLCARFSPVHEALLATGCLQGKIAFCQPKL